MRGRLLLVEDDVALTDLLTWHFEREDFIVEHVTDGDPSLTDWLIANPLAFNPNV